MNVRVYQQSSTSNRSSGLYALSNIAADIVPAWIMSAKHRRVQNMLIAKYRAMHQRQRWTNDIDLYTMKCPPIIKLLSDSVVQYTHVINTLGQNTFTCDIFKFVFLE